MEKKMKKNLMKIMRGLQSQSTAAALASRAIKPDF